MAIKALLISTMLATAAISSHLQNAIAQQSYEPTKTQNRLRFSEKKSDAKNVVYQEWQDTERDRTIPVKIYLPQSGSAPFPVVIFSHGLGGSREAAVYLGEYWSKHGYLCVFVQHPGSDSGVWKSAMEGGKQAIFENMKAAANGRNLVDRGNDIKFVLSELEKKNISDGVLKKQLDLTKIALAGHSFGAGTALLMAGQSFGPMGNMKDTRIKAAIYLCPPVGRGKIDPSKTYGDIKIPGLLLTGTEDNSPIGDTKAEDRRIPFDGIKSTHQYFINFVGADHAVFGGRSFRPAVSTDDKFHEMIEQVTANFLDSALRDQAKATTWLNSNEITAYLGRAAHFEKK
ncbi:MAG: hypothetical protein IAF58_09630 [Leptolyngbya sp.]|nr:hypothetical protein [Candidatus Melainabacteria bacterium]